uniref:IF rod domain-containing protein n=1 Tax=Parastrongyloides trichosuri TaxID=131310 RepID=A0A0N5A043_PARTI
IKMNNNELQIAQQQISELSAKLREVTVEWNAQSHRYKLDIDELKLTINRLKEINDNANRYIYQIEHEKEMYQNKVVEMDGFIKQNEITISNLIIKNKEMKELNEEYKEKLNEQIQKCSDLALRPSEISLKIEFEKQKEDFENKLNDLTESKAFLRGEFE